jgi:predicted TIM-barrel fold metal-dependent hydrolase
MPVQRFAPMTKDFATFDCDAHVTEPPLIWERAKDFLTRDELDALKRTIWWDADSRLLIVNGRVGVGLGSPRKGGIPGTMRVITNAGPGVKHDIQRALNVRNLNPKTALTEEQVAYLDHAGSYEPKPRLRDMNIQGIDQVMIIPTEIDIYPWLEDALGAKAFCRAYNEWAYEYTRADPERLFFAALIPMQHPDYAVEEIRRVAALGCRVALVRPMDAMGNYPMQPKYEPVWDALEETGMVYGMHPFPAFGSSKPSGYSEQYSGAELIRRTVATAGLPHSFLTNVQNFQSEAALWVTVVLMSGFFDRHPKINAAVFEASSTWLSFLIDECDKAYRLYRNERQLPPLKKLPSETFFEHCMTGFEGDEAPPARLPEFYGDILCWSSDVYHHDGDDAWRAIETMRKYNPPVEDQAKFLGGNARRLYKVQAPANIIRERVTEIERPDWWPTDEEVRAARRGGGHGLNGAVPRAGGEPVSRRDRCVQTVAPDAQRPRRADGKKAEERTVRTSVFDGDSHVSTALLWEKYLDPNTACWKHALWRKRDARRLSKVTARSSAIRETPTRRAMHCGGRAWTGMQSVLSTRM